MKETGSYYSKTFGGLIYELDYEPENKRSLKMAQRIAADWEFDEMCKRNAERRDSKAWQN